MTRRALLLLAAALGAVAGLSGCAALGGAQPVHVTVIGIEPLPAETMELRMAVKLRIQNPNDTPVQFDGVALELDLQGAAFATGVSAEQGAVPRFGEIVVTVPVSISAFAAVRQALDLAAHQAAPVDYALRGRLAGAVLGGVHFESKGQIDLSRLAGPAS
jgi:LEA14-like dessication related protein